MLTNTSYQRMLTHIRYQRKLTHIGYQTWVNSHRGYLGQNRDESEQKLKG